MIGIQYMVVQREETTGKETILLEEVYQSRYGKLKSSETVVGMMLSGEVKLYKVVGPQVLVLYMDTQECHKQVRCTGNRKILIMLDSPENPCMME
jgi:hypothetical protein